MKTTEQRISDLMAGRRLRATNPGPRTFPKYTGQSTGVYVMQYRLENLPYACFRTSEVSCATHSPNPNP